MNKQNNGSGKKAKTVVIFSSIAAVAIIGVVASLHYYYANNTAVAQPNEFTPRPPPMELATYGPKSASFAEAKTLAGLDQVKLPSYVPNGIGLESTRTLVQTERTMITAIYTPEGKQTADSDDFRKVIADGALAILYIRDIQYSDPKFDWEQVVQQSVDEAPEVRTKVNINGYTALLVTGDASKEISSKAKIFVDGTFIELVSMNLGPEELQKILQSMVTA